MRLFGAANALTNNKSAGAPRSRGNPEARITELEKRLADANDRAVAAEARASQGGGGGELRQFQQMLDDMPVNVMTCDPQDLTVTYANKTSLDTLRTIEHLLPIAADELVGSCIDIFHKDPSHQRRLLANPDNLPHTAEIRIGDEVLELLVTAIYDGSGNYVSAMLTWSVITAKAKAAADSARLYEMVDNMPVNVMTCDPRELTVTYANKTSLDTLRTIEHLLPIAAGELVGSCIDIFHKDPSHQRRLLANPDNLPHTAEIRIGDEVLELLVTAIYDDGGNYVSAMLTWSVITAKAKAAAENRGLVETLEAIGRSQAMIEFEMDGTVVSANGNFVGTLGYDDESELKGKHHSMFIDATFREGPEYRQFWDDLRAGKFQAGVFKRIRRDGGEIWIQAAYNPVLDADGKPYKVVKNAVDITAEKAEQMGLAENMKSTVEVVASASQEMQSSAQSMAATAEQTNKQSMAVAAASEEASQNVQTVAAAAEELSSSITEISRQVSQSNTISQEAVDQAHQTNVTVQGLAEAAQKIGDVVDLINDIASQTNLLALNATIEAARAGEAGKGFAVVASEVKNLANQTAKATEDIAAQITSMQSVTSDAVAAIDGITKTIAKISEIAGAISAAVEEQGAATQEISQNVTQAAAGTSEVSQNIAGVTQAAQESGHSASQVLEAAQALAEEGDRMRQMVEDFLAKLDG